MDFSLENFSMVDFNYFDVTISAIIIILGIKGFVNGFIKEFFGLAGLIAGVYFASRLSEKAARFIEANFLQLDNSAILKLIGFLAVLILIWVGATLVGTILSKLTSASGLGFINRLLGLVIGGGKYFIIFALIVTALSNVKLIKEKVETYTQGSQLFPYLYAAGSYLINLDTKALGLEATPFSETNETNATSLPYGQTPIAEDSNNSNATTP
ncbi:CvpA family protein [Sulfurovum sp.]|jgi:membrane protein required for colicin V production|uniref:CvpA family protein n=1 Tax=Sulfurovum sp. TaxID=1969726 RepID=UPI002A3726D3|nr:CvpA family protein [Sulfurovum sp.]MDD2451275.1 CvpA family protein [Sulfurovum sp.]MDD3499575.1 CvpA family protein [Sulfurovum sp.]MDY0403224.1 CvpA family protein [Sulfurovum sp.]